MDAWEKLIAGSTIESGDAWEHLMAQGGGGGTGTVDYIILADEMTVEMANETVMVEIDSHNISAEVDNYSIGVGIDDQEIIAEVTNGTL
jgi:hypothetical protein